MQADNIFVSYSRADSKFVLKLAEDLQSAGLTIWIDQAGIRPSEPWDKEIEKALEAAECIIVILSHSSIASSNVLNEINYAIEEKKRVLPLVINRDIKKPLNIRRLQHIDFTHSYNQGLDLLLSALYLEKQTIIKGQSSYKHAIWIAIIFMAFIIVGGLIQFSTSKTNPIRLPQVEGKKNREDIKEKEYVIAGTVVDGSSNKSIELAQVTIVGRSEVYMTEGNGNFRIEFKLMGSSSKQFRIRVSKPGYSIYDRMVLPPVEDMIVVLEKK